MVTCKSYQVDHTRDILAKWGMNVYHTCPLCGATGESHFHFFFLFYVLSNMAQDTTMARGNQNT